MTLQEADAIGDQNSVLQNMVFTCSALGNHIDIDPEEAMRTFQLIRHLVESVSVRLTEIAKGPYIEA